MSKKSATGKLLPRKLVWSRRNANAKPPKKPGWRHNASEPQNRRAWSKKSARRLAAAEEARLEQQEREHRAAEKARLEQQEQERQRLEEGFGAAAPSAEVAIVSPAFKKIAAIVGGILVLLVLLYWAMRPKQPEVAKGPPQEYKSQASNPPPAETSSNKPPSGTQNSEAKLETPKSAAELRTPGRLSKKSETAGTAKASNPSKPQPTPPDPKQIAAAITEGDWHKQRGEYKQAITAYEKGLALDPSNAELKKKIQEARTAKQAEDQILGKNPGT